MARTIAAGQEDGQDRPKGNERHGRAGGTAEKIDPLEQVALESPRQSGRSAARGEQHGDAFRQRRSLGRRGAAAARLAVAQVDPLRPGVAVARGWLAAPGRTAQQDEVDTDQPFRATRIHSGRS